MMVYNDDKKHILLFRINPLMKIILMVLITLFVTFDYMPFLPLAMLILCILSTVLLGKIRLKDFINTISPFLLMAMGFLIFTLISRGLSINGSPDITLLGLKWSYGDILIAVSLCLRILTVAAWSASFVITTNPVDFILSLMKYLHLPYKIGYAVLAAYRFLPTFKDELMSIRFAHEVRGVEDKKGFLSKITSFKRYLIPMLATAVRRGERISFAMETRAFGAYKNRTTYRELSISREDIVFLISSLLICIIIFIIFYNLNLLNLSLGFSLK